MPILSNRHRPRHWRRRLSLTLVLALGALTAGCDGASEAIQEVVGSESDAEADPTTALQDAIAALADWQGVTAEFRLEADEAARADLIAEDELSAEEADLLLGASIVVQAGELSGANDPDSAGLATSILVGGTAVFDLRVTGERFFVRVDLDRLSELSQDTDLGDLDDLLDTARTFGLGDVAQAAADGRWVELIGIDDAMDLAGAETTEQPEVDEQQREALAERLADTFRAFVDDDVAVSYVGEEEAGERVRIVTDGASLDELLTELTDEFDRAGLLDDVAGADLDELAIDDDATVSVDAWIAGGELRQLGFDLRTLDDADALPGEAYILVAMEEFTGSIDAPQDAEPFDVLSLVGAFFAGFGGDALGDDAFGDDAFGDDAFGDEDLLGDDTFGGEDGEPECITAEELAELEQLAGPDAAAQFQDLIDAGFLELC